ncbi:uncharacterized protein B0I36DRAFT_254080 [Microdochium trichocladiopsis]|uniref:DUF3638 domain-containing protein n=1 Tax=Microdochium trichocladiopsis TaxID=1682393 RepID=A0A9P9BJQ3_9PEZI|nr:uncharacterized protein B0I36DRAFT_254080 [Microdochium trichocladiopsis]KAH7016239.1 hypothetical protein B0I36DRAFT_254080 [Microdochium trichocladiopsis]
MQLNTGEVRSSVVVPTSPADGDKLMRVLVGKPQSKQMAHMLTSKLGGLIDRQVLHLPFSHAIKAGQAELAVIDKLLSRCQTGVVYLLCSSYFILLADGRRA